MRNKVLYFEYTIESPCDDEVLFPGVCAVHLFNQLQLREYITIKFVAGIPSPDKGAQIICDFSQRHDVEFIHNKLYGGMIFRFLGTVKTNTTLLPLLQLDSIGTQYIASPNPFSDEFLATKWNVSEKSLIQLDLAKFICSIDQDRTLRLFFSGKYYCAEKLKEELFHWEQSICEITRMSHMERKTINPFRIPRFVNITVYE